MQIPWLLHTDWSGHKPEVSGDGWVAVVVVGVVVVAILVYINILF